MGDEDLLLADKTLPFGSGVIGVCDICGKRQAVIVLQKERYKLCVLDFLNKAWLGSKAAPGRPLPPFRSDRVWFDSPAAPGGRGQGILLTPTKEVRHPAVLVTSDVFGLTTMVLDAGLRLAHEGFEVFLPDLTKTELLGASDHVALRADARFRGGVRVESARVRKTVTFYNDALAFLRARPMVDPQKTAVFGASYGGSLALAVAGEDRTITAVAVASPVPIEPANYLRLLNAPVLIVAGGRDPVAARSLAQVRAQKGSGIDVQEEIYSERSHLFLARDSGAYDLASAEAAWKRILLFLRERLVPPPPKPPTPPVVKPPVPAPPAVSAPPAAAAPPPKAPAPSPTPG